MVTDSRGDSSSTELIAVLTVSLSPVFVLVLHALIDSSPPFFPSSLPPSLL